MPGGSSITATTVDRVPENRKKPMRSAKPQQALACAAALSLAPARPHDLKNDAPDAAKILLRNGYGWFVRVERGLYGALRRGQRGVGALEGAPSSRDRGGTDGRSRIIAHTAAR